MRRTSNTAGQAAVQHTFPGAPCRQPTIHLDRAGAKGPQSDEGAWDCQRLAPEPSSQDVRPIRAALTPCSVRDNETELRELMEEPPGGPNHGRQARVLSPEDPGLDRGRALGVLSAQARDFRWAGGWAAVDSTRGSEGRRTLGAGDAGMSAHRGVLAGDEYIDSDALSAMVERELGFTIEQVRSVYRLGPKTTEQRELRGQIDARLLALSRSGGSMLELARVFGWALTSAGGGDRCKTMERAVARAKAAELPSEGSAS